MKWLARIFLRGLVTILPVGATLYLLYWLGQAAENAVSRVLQKIFPGMIDIPGLGLVVGVLFILATGLLLSARIFQSLFTLLMSPLEKTPVVRSIYRSIKDLMDYVAVSKEESFNKVVMVSVAGTPVRLVGFITRETFQDLPLPAMEDNPVAVYLPMSYQVGGYMVFIPRDWISPINMNFDEAFRFVLTAGVKSAKKK